MTSLQITQLTDWDLDDIVSHFRTTKRTISITTMHNNEEVPMYRRGYDANTITELVDRTSAYPALDRETIR